MDGETNFLLDLASCEEEKKEKLYSDVDSFFCSLILQKISLHIAAVATKIDEVSCVNESKNCWKSQQRIAAGIVTL